MHRRLLVSVLLLPVIAIASAGPAEAAPKVAGTFALSGTPGRVTEGPNGDIWVLLSGSGVGSDIARVEADGTVTEYDSDDLANSVGLASGPDDRIWVTKFQAVGSFDPADPSTVDLTALTDVSGQDLAIGPDGQFWTAGDGGIVSIPPGDPGSAVLHPVAGFGGRGIAAGEDGRIWAVDFAGQRLIRMKTDGDYTETPVGGAPQQIAAGPDDQMAYTNPDAADTVVGLVAGTGDPDPVAMPNTDPFGITFALDGAYWTARFAADDLARVTPQGKQTKLGGFPAGSGPRYLSTGENGTLWVSLETSQEVAKVTGVTEPKPPKVKITKAPKSRVEAKRGKAKVKFAFKSKTEGAKFRCSLERRGRKASFAGCRSPARYRLKPGRYEFQVKAKADGTTGKPARATFKVKG